MRSKWIEHRGQKIFYQDFSQFFYDYEGVKTELKEVQDIVIQEPPKSLLIISNFSDTTIAGDLMTALNESSRITKDHVKKTAVIGVTGMKRRLGDMLSKLTGQPLKYFDNEFSAKEWLTEE